MKRITVIIISLALLLSAAAAGTTAAETAADGAYQTEGTEAMLPAGGTAEEKGAESASGDASTEGPLSAVSALPVAAESALAGQIRAKACALMDVNTGTLMAATAEHERLYPASVTKIMTLLLVCEALEQGKLTLNDVLTCSDTAAAKGGSQIWLEPGEEMSVDDLLKASVIASANDACTLLAEAVAGSETAFVAMMNERAAELGMADTVFDNCTGLDDDTENHRTSAYDIALMARELLRHDLIRSYASVWMDDLRGGKTQLVNTNKLVRYYSGCTGLKTGTTSKAGCCVAASAERDGMELVAVILGADSSSDRFAGARALLDWGFANFEIYTPENDLSLLTEVRVNHGLTRRFLPACEKGAPLLVPKGVGSQVTKRAEYATETDAPLAEGERIGRIVFEANGETVAENDVYCPEEIPAMDLLNAWKLLFFAFSREV